MPFEAYLFRVATEAGYPFGYWLLQAPFPPIQYPARRRVSRQLLLPWAAEAA